MPVNYQLRSPTCITAAAGTSFCQDLNLIILDMLLMDLTIDCFNFLKFFHQLGQTFVHCPIFLTAAKGNLSFINRRIILIIYEFNCVR